MNFFSLGVTARALRANIGSKSAISLQPGPVDPKFQVEGIAPTNHSSSQKTRLYDLSYGIKTWTDLSSVLSQYTRLIDGQTDKHGEFSSLHIKRYSSTLLFTLLNTIQPYVTLTLNLILP